MAVTRWKSSVTGENARTLIDAINDPNIKLVTLFASPVEADSAFSADSDGPETNLPLLVALAESVTGNLTVYDGLFLTAARKPRYLEIRDVLDTAVASNKVYFSERRTPFTSVLAPDDAAQKLSQLNPVLPLRAVTRPQFFRLLSGVTEAQYAEL